MSIAMVERSLFNHKDGANTIIKHRFLGFLIWQSLPATPLFLLFPPFTLKPSIPSFFSFLSFHSSLLIFSTSLFFLSSPQSHPAASPFELLLASVRLVLVPTSRSHPTSDPAFRLRVRLSLSFLLFVAVCALSASVAVISLCWGFDVSDRLGSKRLVVGKLGFKGLAVGFFYGLFYVYKQRWVLQFPIIQRPLFFSFKMRLPFAIGQALKLSVASYLLSSVLALILPNQLNGQGTAGKFVMEQLIFYMGSFLVFLCWELSHHLHQVFHTKRFVFAPPKGSAAAETNPSEPLLATLVESTPKSLLQYLAYLDLCMVSESNVDSWRRAAFFEETGETYKRAIAVSLTPLEQFVIKMSEGLESASPDDSFQLSQQLRPPTERLADAKFSEVFNDLQLCVWCARIVASLTVRSHKEDRYGVAQLSGSNAAVMSTLLSGLLAVETLMGKKTSLKSRDYLMDPAGIKWATLNAARRDSSVAAAAKGKDNPLYGKAYLMADILRTSVYHIVSAFYGEMLKSERAGLLEKDWIGGKKPFYGSRELLLQKLQMFLDFQAN